MEYFGEWEDLPPEILCDIFSYLSRRDRMSCSLVCKNWQNALDTKMLWKRITVHIDTDLIEPSTMMFTRKYYSYLKTLELGWAYPQCSGRWLYCRHQDLTKKVVRFIITLTESFVQLGCIKIFDWFDTFRFKKIVYQLTRFLSFQYNLKKIVLHNANLYKLDGIKLLAACLGSKEQITYLDIHNYYYYQSAFDSIHFLSCLEQLSNLQVLKLDYFILCRGVIDAILVSCNDQLSLLEINISELDRANSHEIPEEQWKELRSRCPKLKVSVILRNICHFEDVSLFLKNNMPLKSFSMFASRKVDQSRQTDYRHTLLMLLRCFKNTLEHINFQLQANLEILDDLLVKFVHVCPNLKYFEFHGLIKDLDMLKSMCHVQVTNKSDLKYFTIFPINVTEEQHTFFKQIYVDYKNVILENSLNFKVINCNYNYSNMVYVYY